MPTIELPPDPTIEQVKPEVFDFGVYAQQLDSLAESGVDLGERALLEDKAKELIGAFELDERFFSSPVKSILFTSIANRMVSEPQDYRTQEAMCEALLLVAGPDGPDNGKLYEDQFEGKEQQPISVYDRFTNQEVTRDLKQAIADGLLDGVKARMGITPDVEEPYEVRVLNVTSERTSSMATYGIKPSVKWEELEGDELDEAFRDQDRYRDYVKGLIANGEEFRKLTGDKPVPIAWVDVIAGKKTLFLQLPTAEKILYKDQPRAEDYEGDGYESDLALVEHEYTHTQDGFLTTIQPDVGIGPEELKAEHYSGNKHGYTDVKRHFLYISAISGIKVNEIFDQFGPERPFSAGDFYKEVAQRGGLEYMLDMALVFPNAYFERDAYEAESQKIVTSYISSIDHLQEKVWKDLVRKQGEEVVSSRLEELVNGLLESEAVKEGRITVQEWVNYAGNTFIGRKILESAHSKQNAT